MNKHVLFQHQWKQPIKERYVLTFVLLAFIQLVDNFVNKTICKWNKRMSSEWTTIILWPSQQTSTKRTVKSPSPHHAQWNSCTNAATACPISTHKHTPETRMVYHRLIRYSFLRSIQTVRASQSLTTIWIIYCLHWIVHVTVGNKPFTIVEHVCMTWWHWLLQQLTMYMNEGISTHVN